MNKIYVENKFNNAETVGNISVLTIKFTKR